MNKENKNVDKNRHRKKTPNHLKRRQASQKNSIGQEKYSTEHFKKTERTTGAPSLVQPEIPP